MDDHVTVINGVGTVAAGLLKKLGIVSISDLLRYYPRRYDDYSRVVSISSIKPGMVCIKADIRSVSGRYMRRGLHITEAIASDESGSVRLVWFNQPYRENTIRPGALYFVVGEFGLHARRMSITNPSIELEHDNESQLHTARIVPVYRETKGINSQQIRKYIASALKLFETKLPEILPLKYTKDLHLMGYKDAIYNMHFPKDVTAMTAAKKRLGFDELFVLMVASLLNKQELKGEHALNINFNEDLAKKFVSHLPFQLTNSQRKVIWQMYLDMQNDMPMNRLLEGDVGSGKTVAATMAALMVLSAGYQVAFMAPTEILARQHAETILQLLKPLGFGDQVVLLTGSTKRKEIIKNKLRDNLALFVVGTHALLTEDFKIPRLGLVVVDEQHRFGVDQRKRLQAKSNGHMPHVLHMTATPIPRSLALTVYGDLDISIIDVMPNGRKPVHTKLISPNSLRQLYDNVEKELKAGHQAFWVCPIITESNTLCIKSVEKVYDELRQGPFKHRKLALLHGRMKSKQKEDIMKDFSAGNYDILVSTTVIEVGVDIASASVMVIEEADRFGLAQLHQLRGRVGRGSKQSYCYLILSDSKRPSKRLRIIEQSNNGFELAEFDLKERGPGAIYGLTQHGVLDLKIADISDVKLIASARSAARDFIEKPKNLLHYTEIALRVANARAITNIN